MNDSSVGAARLLRETFLQDFGERFWAIGGAELRCSALTMYFGDTVEWSLNNTPIPRSAARIVLRGLLAERTAQELHGIADILARIRSGCPVEHQTLGIAEARLREMAR